MRIVRRKGEGIVVRMRVEEQRVEYSGVEIPKQFAPRSFEQKWYSFWMEHGLFHSEPDEREPYTVVIPPPNVTGILHMGHMLNNTIQDVLVRRARMLGFNACWVPGTDHASIATEAKVVEKLREQGIDKHDLTREEFLRHAWDWTHKHGGIILEQLKRLGASCDWERTAFTMDEVRSKSVIHVFVDLYRKGYIYRGVRMVNWDPAACTALSDEEVLHREVDGKLYYLKYMLKDGGGDYVEVATTRPETIMGDVAVCVNPEDPRYKGMVGREVVVPLVNRVVPLIADSYVDREFGTGALKITPAHDINDYTIGERYHLPSLDIFDDHGRITEAAGLYVGMDRFDVRERITHDLEAAGLMSRVENYRHSVGFSERTNAVIEPKLSQQWFLRMQGLARPALEAVERGDVKLTPSKFEGMYRHWLEEVQDWCISRQLWWGHQIPVWYYGDAGGYVVAENAEEALSLARAKEGYSGLREEDLRQDPDVLDTWFSSWLWPMSVFNGVLEPENREIQYYYPTQDLVTAPEIIFFWVARMIIAGYEYRGTHPFGRVYFTGIVRDAQRRKMSKSLGNSPDPILLMERYGADGVRVGMLMCANAGNDLLFDEKLCEQGRNFCNKIWNAFRLVKGWQVGSKGEGRQHSKRAVEMFEAYLSDQASRLDDLFSQYRLSEALTELYRLFCEDFSGWLLEMVKPPRGGVMDPAIYDGVLNVFEALLWYLHPFIPFLSEEVWHGLRTGRDERSLMLEKLPILAAGVNDRVSAVAEYELLKSLVSAVRGVRADQRIEPKRALTLHHRGELGLGQEARALVMSLAGLEGIEECQEVPKGVASFLVNTLECFVDTGVAVDTEQERARLEQELEYQRGFLRGVEKKLSNTRFVENAPSSVVELERKKREDALARIEALARQLECL